MRILPKLFSTPMVQAILARRKTVTRRGTGLEEVNENPDAWRIGKTNTRTVVFHPNDGTESTTVFIIQAMPCTVGDIIYVRESWAAVLECGGGSSSIIYKADFPEGKLTGWKPSLHLKREHSRIWLRVTNVTCERLQSITEESARAEGVLEYEDGTYKNYFTSKGLRASDGVECLLAKGSFQSLWHSINGADSWNLNPWVWVIEFEVLSTTGRPDGI